MIVATFLRFLCAAGLLVLSWVAPPGPPSWLITGAACALAVSALDSVFSRGRGELADIATVVAVGGSGAGLVFWGTASGAFDVVL